MAENCWRVWGTPANFNGFCDLAALLHGTPAVGISQTLRHWTEGATYIHQGGHRVGHWPTFLVCNLLPVLEGWCERSNVPSFRSQYRLTTHLENLESGHGKVRKNGEKSGKTIISSCMPARANTLNNEMGFELRLPFCYRSTSVIVHYWL